MKSDGHDEDVATRRAQLTETVVEVCIGSVLLFLLIGIWYWIFRQ